MLQKGGGNVGIGTTTPSSKLHVLGGAIFETNSDIVIKSTNGSDPGDLVFISNTGSELARIYSAVDTLYFSAGISPSTEMTIKSNGNVGIGTTSPSYPLHVATQVSNKSIYATYDIVAYSDISVKTNIRPIDNVLERVINSRGVLYDRIDSGEKDNIGFIAQELEEQFPELIVENPDGTKAVKYQNAVAILFEAIKEQQKQINELRNGITD